jgi:hypothetical protein
MEELEKLTQILGGPKNTAVELGVDVRSYYNYKAGKIPTPMFELIKLKLKEHQDNPSPPAALPAGK